MVNNNKLIGQMLISAGVITPKELELGLAEQEKSGDFICNVLVRLKFSSEDKIFSVLARQLDIPYVKLKDCEIPGNVIDKVPAKFASHYKIMPLAFEDDLLKIAMVDPLDIRAMDDLKMFLGVQIAALLASEAEIKQLIRKYYGVGADTVEGMISKNGGFSSVAQEKENVQDLGEMVEDASIVKFVNQILAEAVKDRATDVHLEPFQDELRVRFRIDGVLYDINVPENVKYFHAAIVSRVKIMARLNIAERRMPQDGRIKIKVLAEELDLRVSVIPTVFGESVQLRILSAGSFLDLTKLGLSKNDLEVLKKVISKPHGIIFVTGPTGSGKSTTLYAALSHINSSQVKIITIEDPVEYQLRGVNQIQINPQIGFTFANALRHMLRHDPDIMMVGEVRDFETAEIAIRSALTGHLVFSTLHTNDAAGAITRLLDMGIEPFLVSSSLECLIAQRLVRLLCPKCKKAISPSKEIISQFAGASVNADIIKLYEAVGCDECRHTGYKGRTAIYEILVINDSIREMIISRASSHEIKQKAVKQGMRVLLQDGLEKVALGLTTVAEILRVTQEEEAV